MSIEQLLKVYPAGLDKHSITVAVGIGDSRLDRELGKLMLANKVEVATVKGRIIYKLVKGD